MAVAFEYSLLENCTDKHVVLSEAFKIATTCVLEYLESENITEASAFYKRADSYDKIMDWYK